MNSRTRANIIFSALAMALMFIIVHQVYVGLRLL